MRSVRFLKKGSGGARLNCEFRPGVLRFKEVVGVCDALQSGRGSAIPAAASVCCLRTRHADQLKEGMSRRVEFSPEAFGYLIDLYDYIKTRICPLDSKRSTICHFGAGKMGVSHGTTLM
jgi:hypothetical protein